MEDLQNRPNIVLLMSDDQGWGDVGYNGNPVIQTPFTDALAEEGVRLNRFYAAAPVCSPTRGSCITGRHPYRYGVFWADMGHLPREEVSLATVLKNQGYRTGHFGKWHLGTLSETITDATRGGARNQQEYSPPWEHGFDECFSTESSVPTYNPLVWGGGVWDPANDLGPGFRLIMDRPVRRGEEPDRDDVDPWHGSYWTGPGNRVREGLDGDDSAIIMDRCLSFIEAATEQRTPFFTLVWFHTPHTPIAAGDAHREPYLDHPMEAQHFYGCITAMDQQIGRLRNELRRLDIADNTLLWFCSDNGPSYVHDYNSAGPLRGKKATLFEGGIRVPSVVEWPAGLTGGRQVDTPIVTSDFLPTLAEIIGAGLDSARPLDGMNVLPILQGRQAARNRPIEFQSPVRGAASDATTDRQIALIDDRYKILSRNDGTVYELFDLIEDPGESTDLSAEQPDRVDRMRAHLESWFDSCAQSLAGEDYDPL